MLPIGHSYTTEVSFTAAPTTNQQINFNQTPIFSNADIAQYIRIKGLITYTSDNLSKSPQGANVVSFNGLKGIAVNLVGTDSSSILWDFPASNLYAYLNGGFYYEFDNLKINFTGCYLKIFDPSAISAGQAAVFTWIYEDIRKSTPAPIRRK